MSQAKVIAELLKQQPGISSTEQKTLNKFLSFLRCGGDSLSIEVAETALRETERHKLSRSIATRLSEWWRRDSRDLSQ
jgi:hypothetical protein